MGIRILAPGCYYFDPEFKNDETERVDVALKLSGIPANTRLTHRLYTYEEDEGNQQALSAAMAFIRGEIEPPLLFLYGRPGLGKTHLAFAIGWCWIMAGRSVAYYQVEELMDALRQGYRVWQAKALNEPAGDSYDSIMRWLRAVPLLILDDLGAHHGTDWAASKLDEVVNYREKQGLPLVVTANGLEVPDRILDRMKEGAVVRIRGESRRGKCGHVRSHQTNNRGER